MGSPSALVDSKFILIRQEFETPSTRKDLVSLFENIVSGGGVKKLVLEIGHPIKVDRYVRPEDAATFEVPPTNELQHDDIYAAARNHEMYSLETSDPMSPYEYLFKAFQYATIRGFKPVTLLVNRAELLRSWLNLDEMLPVTHVYGIDVVPHPAIPEDCTLLVCNDAEGNIAFSVRVEIRFAKRKKKEKA